MNETTVIIQHDLDLSPAEFARRIAELIDHGKGLHIEAAEGLGRVRYTDIETIQWTFREEHKAAIIDHGPGYGSDDHLRILRRAGYGRA